MRILLAVIDDLFQFARAELFGFSMTEPNVSPLKPFITSASLAVSTYTPSLPVAPQTKKVLPDVFMQGEKYFIGARDIFLYVDPVIAFDTAIRELTYGDLVHVLKFAGRWAQVRTSMDEGWILKDCLREQASDIFPSFIEGVVYDAESPQTQKVRLCIDDIFGGTTAATSLTDVEYVTYMLHKRGVTISWSKERPRIAGTWLEKLKGKQGIHASISPKTSSIMEYVENEIGHVCFVEAVFPGEGIKISSVGMHSEGMFTDVVLQKEEWRELRPVFIEVT